MLLKACMSRQPLLEGGMRGLCLHGIDVISGINFWNNCFSGQITGLVLVGVGP